MALDFSTLAVQTYESRILNATVDTLRADTPTGYHVTIKAYNNDRGRLSVFIDSPNYEDSKFKTLDIAELDSYIEANTGGGADGL